MYPNRTTAGRDLRRKKSNQMSIGEAVELFIDQCGLREMMLIHRVKQEWSGIVGEQIAAATDEIQTRNGTFILKLRAPNWKNELVYRRTEIKDAINQYAGSEICTDVWIN